VSIVRARGAYSECREKQLQTRVHGHSSSSTSSSLPRALLEISFFFPRAVRQTMNSQGLSIAISLPTIFSPPFLPESWQATSRRAARLQAPCKHAWENACADRIKCMLDGYRSLREKRRRGFGVARVTLTHSLTNKNGWPSSEARAIAMCLRHTCLFPPRLASTRAPLSVSCDLPVCSAAARPICHFANQQP